VSLPEGLAPAIHRQSAGNPLVMATLTEELVAKGLLVREAGTWVLKASGSALDAMVPETLRRITQLKLERLTAPDRQILEAASLLPGETFSAGAIAVALDVDPVQVDERCERLAIAQQLLRLDEIRTLPNGLRVRYYAFTHALDRLVLSGRPAPAPRLVSEHRWPGERPGVPAPSPTDVLKFMERAPV
jgi:predicted ATPase